MRSLWMGRKAILLLLAGAALSACGDPAADTRTVTDGERLSRFDLPTEWHIYELPELSTLEQLPFNSAYQGFNFPAVSSVGFDGAPVEDVSYLTTDLADADYPLGSASVRQVGDVEREFLSRAMLSQSVLPYRNMANAEELQKEDFSFGGGFDGVRVLVSFENETGNDLGVAYMISVSDPEDTRIYSIVAGCNRECFIANQETITKVVDSWLVNKRG